METHSCMNVTLFKHDSGRRDREREGQDRTVLGDTSHVGDVTGEDEKRGRALGFFEEEEADRSHVRDIPQSTGDGASLNLVISKRVN